MTRPKLPALIVFLAAASLLGGRSAETSGAPGPLGIEVAPGGKPVEQPFLHSAPTDAAKIALRDRRDAKQPLHKLDAVAQPGPIALPPPAATAARILSHHGLVPCPTPPAGCPRGPPAA